MISKAKSKKLTLVGIFICFSACHPVDNRETSQFKQEMEDRKLQRITEGQLTAFASKIGAIILDSNFKIQNPGFLAKLDSFYGIKIESKKIEEINLGNKLFNIAEAYTYNQENNIPMEDNLQKDGDSILLYTRPIMINNTFAGISLAHIDKKKLIKKYTNKTIQFEF